MTYEDVGIRCPECNSTFSRVTNTEPVKDAIKRRRECLDCGWRWNTFECIERIDETLKRDRQEVTETKKYMEGVINTAIEVLTSIQKGLEE